MSGISRINAVYLFLLGVKMKLNFRELWLRDPPSLSTPPVSIYCISVLALQSSYIREWPLITKRKTPAPTTTLALKQPGPHKTRVHWISPQMEPGITIFFLIWTLTRGCLSLAWSHFSPCCSYYWPILCACRCTLNLKWNLSSCCDLIAM